MSFFKKFILKINKIYSFASIKKLIVTSECFALIKKIKETKKIGIKINSIFKFFLRVFVASNFVTKI